MKLKKIAEILDGNLTGEEELDIKGINSLDNAGHSDLSHIEKDKYLEIAANSKAGAFIVNKSTKIENRNTIEVKDVKIAHIKALGIFSTRHKHIPYISKKACIDKNVKIGKDVTIYENVTIMSDCEIGNNSILFPGVVLEWGAKIGKNCILYPNVIIGENCIIGDDNIFYGSVVIGTDGYGYHDTKEKRHKIPQIGIVRTGKRVELGANTCIDRATMGETYIGDDTKFDNLCQLGHNCNVGKKSYIVAQVGIAGSTQIGNNVILTGQVGVVDHVKIGDNVFVGPQGGIDRDLKDGEKVWNSPAVPMMKALRINKCIKELPALVKTVKYLEDEIKKIIVDKE
jgi:UDP-3-O-[3-hydroxymyristoyl] glucosamine N-acyltransferase